MRERELDGGEWGTGTKGRGDDSECSDVSIVGIPQPAGLSDYMSVVHGQYANTGLGMNVV